MCIYIYIYKRVVSDEKYYILFYWQIKKKRNSICHYECVKIMPILIYSDSCFFEVVKCMPEAFFVRNPLRVIYLLVCLFETTSPPAS